MKKLLKGIFSIIIVGLLVLTSLGYIEYKAALSEISLEDKVAQIQEKETYVKIDEVSDFLLKATVTTEDQRFYEHHGIDYFAYGRIALVFLKTKKISGGGSTITQQLSKNMYFGYEPSIIRKIAELFMTRDIEKNYEKDEILELYVNIINYGDNYMGIYNASKGYFDKHPKDLNFNEATLVAGIPQSPANYQLSNQSEKTYKRQQAVIQTLIDTQTFTQEEIDIYLSESE